MNRCTRLLPLAFALALGAALLPDRPASAQTVNANASAFPLASNVLFPARATRYSLRCYNPTTNGAVTITYPSGFQIVLQPGGSLWETGGLGPQAAASSSRVPIGQILATGTSTQTVQCEEIY